MSLHGESSGHEASAAGPSESPPLDEWSDGVLAHAVVLRQVDAFAELRRRHLESVAAVARMVLGNRASCEDVVSEVFVGFWLAPQKFDPDRGTVLAYLRLNARGRSIDVVRSETARRRRELAEDLEPSEEESDAAMIGAESASELRGGHPAPDGRAHTHRVGLLPRDGLRRRRPRAPASRRHREVEDQERSAPPGAERRPQFVAVRTLGARLPEQEPLAAKEPATSVEP